MCLIGLVFSGRVLKAGKIVADYKVVPGCTIYAMDIKPRNRECSKISVPFLYTRSLQVLRSRSQQHRSEEVS